MKQLLNFSFLFTLVTWPVLSGHRWLVTTIDYNHQHRKFPWAVLPWQYKKEEFTSSFCSSDQLVYSCTGNNPATGIRDPWCRLEMINGTQWRGKLPEASEDMFWWCQQWHRHLFQYLTTRKLKEIHPCHSRRLLIDGCQPFPLSQASHHLLSLSDKILKFPQAETSCLRQELLTNCTKSSGDL